MSLFVKSVTAVVASSVCCLVVQEIKRLSATIGFLQLEQDITIAPFPLEPTRIDSTRFAKVFRVFHYVIVPGTFLVPARLGFQMIRAGTKM